MHFRLACFEEPSLLETFETQLLGLWLWVLVSRELVIGVQTLRLLYEIERVPNPSLEAALLQ